MKKNSFVYNVAYYLTPEKPERTNICKLFWRFAGMFFVLWPVLLVVYGIAAVISFPFGFKPTFMFLCDPVSSESDFIPYGWFPKIKGVPFTAYILKRIFFTPALVPRLVLIVLLMILFFDKDNTEIRLRGFAIVLMVLFTVALVIFMFFLIGNGWKRLKTSSTFILFKDYLKAKRNKLCFTVEFTD